MSWILLWKLLFIVVMAVFIVMAFLVTVLGARDIRRMITELKEDADSVDEVDGPES